MRKHNTMKDFACKGKACCGGLHLMTPQALKAFRLFETYVYDEAVKKATPATFSLIVSSAFRCHSHNGYVGSNKNSYHPQGMAIDVVTPKELHLMEFFETALSVSEYASGGIGVYTWGLHVDVRDIGKPVRWYAVEINRR